MRLPMRAEASSLRRECFAGEGERGGEDAIRLSARPQPE